LGINPDKIVATGDEAKKVEALNQLGISPDNYFDADQAKLDAIRTGTATQATQTTEQVVSTTEPEIVRNQATTEPNTGTSEATTTQITVLEDIEAKKADIERRIQENPSVERGVLINYESGKTKEQLIDIVSKLKKGKITFDEIYEEFSNLPTSTLLEVKKAFN